MHTPLSVRRGLRSPAEHEALRDDLPDWLRPSLWEWVEQGTSKVARMGRLAHLETVRAIERALRFSIGWDGDNGLTGHRLFKAAVHDSDERFLDVADYLLAHLNSRYYDPAAAAADLERLLREAGSGWTVVRTGRQYRLEQRVSEPVRTAAEAVMGRGDRSAKLLSRAWSAVYGRSPDPSDGYRQAVRAVEAVSFPVVLPSDPKATFGRVIGELRSSSDRWSFELSHRDDADLPVRTIITMMDLLWGSQHDRHVNPGEEAPLHVSQSEAEAAIHLAVTLVQWFSSGMLRKP